MSSVQVADGGVARGAEAPARSSRAPFLAAELALLAVIAHSLWLHAVLIRAHVGAAFQFDYEEGNILNALRRILAGDGPYPDPRAVPQILNPYGPVAYYLLAIPAKAFGLAFLPPRVMIVVSLAVVCLCLALILRKLTGVTTIALAFAGFYAASPLVQDWSYLLRVDFLGLAFSLAGLVVFCVWPKMRTVAAVLFAAALLVKYTLIAAPAACLLSLLAHKRWKHALRFAGTIAALDGAVVALSAAVTHGAIFTQLFLSHPDPVHWGVYLDSISWLLAEHRPLVLLAGIFLVIDLRRRHFSPVALWLITASVTTVTMAKAGSNANHLLEWPAAACLCAGLGWHELTRLPSRRWAIVATSAALVWMIFVLLTFRPALDRDSAVRECPQAYRWVREQAGLNVLSENVGALVLGGKKVWVSNPFVHTQLVMRSGWQETKLVDMLREQSFDAVIMAYDYTGVPAFIEQGTDRFTPEVLKAVRESYKVERRFVCQDMGVVYEPRKK